MISDSSVGTRPARAKRSSGSQPITSAIFRGLSSATSSTKLNAERVSVTLLRLDPAPRRRPPSARRRVGAHPRLRRSDPGGARQLHGALRVQQQQPELPRRDGLFPHRPVPAVRPDRPRVVGRRQSLGAGGPPAGYQRRLSRDGRRARPRGRRGAGRRRRAGHPPRVRPRAPVPAPLPESVRRQRSRAGITEGYGRLHCRRLLRRPSPAGREHSRGALSLEPAGLSAPAPRRRLEIPGCARSGPAGHGTRRAHCGAPPSSRLIASSAETRPGRIGRPPAAIWLSGSTSSRTRTCSGRAPP